MITIADAAQRAEALDTRRSFRVTAPAGSGKTELLIQRFLALLPTVSRPEQVLAITFTRKAAAEMLERIVAALWEAEAGNPVESEHQRRTRELAEAALAHGRERGWELSRDIARFNIRTIDGFCSSLARQMPVLSGFGGATNARDDASPLYREAVLELYSLAGSARPEASDLDALLLHFDNNWERLADLLMAMLGKREQWLEYVEAGRSSADAEQRLIATVEALVNEELDDIHKALAPWLPSLYPLLCYAQLNLGNTVPEQCPPATSDNLEVWRALGSMLLTGDGSLRKRVDKRNGFPVGNAEEKQQKAVFHALLDEIREESPDLPAKIERLFWLPNMDAHSVSWQLVIHLSHVLPLLSACLLLVFARRGSVDHTQVAVAALDALGEDDAPTELALRLDYQIEHILVDEFQDTANLQYRLIERLTRDWSEHNSLDGATPRTLFIVGDGMQSIYGFRNANVGLFHRAGEQGFNGLVPEPLALQCNFRSQENVVNWINTTFRDVFPANGNLRRGTVSFSEAKAVKAAAGNDPAVDMHGFYGEDGNLQEAGWLAEQIQQALAIESEDTIAVLGRTRSHLAPLVNELRSRGIPFAAQDMDPLGSSPVVIDLISLCRALANPGDRLAWFAVLRAPWCGLSLADLYLLAGNGDPTIAGNPAAAIISGDPSGKLSEGLSESGRENLARVAQCLRWSWQKRDQLALRVWVEQSWEYLGGPATALEAGQLEDAMHFFALLDKAEQEGVGLDPVWLNDRVNRLYAAGGAPESRLQVMTLHRAKGLEFDWVIMPGLARAPRSDSRQLLLWDEFNGADGSQGFLLAADDHSERDAPGLYNYLRKTRAEKTRHEIARLLYVGTTRAVRRLTLSATLKPEDDDLESVPDDFKSPGSNTLLLPIWPRFSRDMQVHPAAQVSAEESKTVSLRVLRNPPPAPPIPASEGVNLPEAAFNRLERHVGTVTHQLLERLALVQPLPERMTDDLAAYAALCLAQLGLSGAERQQACEMVRNNLNRTLADPQGRWILDANHAAPSCELALTWHSDEGLRDIVIDRTFIDRESGDRWVIDYKSSGPPEGVSLQQFLAEEATRYLSQLRGYRDSLQQLGSEPVRCALYFTRLGLLHPLAELDT